MKKRGFIVIALLILTVITTITSSLLFTNKTMDVSLYSEKYKLIYEKYIKSAVLISDAALIAEYIENASYDSLVFTPVEVLYGDISDEPFLLNLSSAERTASVMKNMDGYSCINAEDLLSGTYTIGKENRNVYQEDLKVGEKYLIVIYKDEGFNSSKYERYHLCLGVITDINYPFSENDIGNADVYVSAADYIKYIEKTEGYGYPQDILYDRGIFERSNKFD